MVQSLQLIQNQLKENRLLEISMKIPEINREVKMLRFQNNLQQDIIKETQAGKLLLKEI